jgi:hypothetical protein
MDALVEVRVVLQGVPLDTCPAQLDQMNGQMTVAKEAPISKRARGQG